MSGQTQRRSDAGESATRSRWVFFTNEQASNGSGPFGPLEASGETAARRIAEARARRSGLTLARVERA